MFSIKVDRPEIVRGGHAYSCDELIMARSGSVLVQCDNGQDQTDIRPCNYDQAIWAKPGVLVRLREFEPQSIFLVCASARYEETRRFARAQRQPDMRDCLG